MTDVTQILSQIEDGDPSAAEQLLPLVYDELRKLAAAKLANEKPGQTLQATALVHDAYIRLVDVEKAQQWNNRGHFFAAAAEAMRRILVESARRKQRVKHGGSRGRVDLSKVDLVSRNEPDELLLIHETIDQLCQDDPLSVKLPSSATSRADGRAMCRDPRCFAGHRLSALVLRQGLVTARDRAFVLGGAEVRPFFFGRREIFATKNRIVV